MNNARYIRELDFARVDFYQRTRLYQRILKKGGGVVQGACTIRYRRFIPTFTVYNITSRVVYWDASSIYMEHRFITPKDGFVRAIAVCKQRVLGVNVEELMGELLGEQTTKADPEAGGQLPTAKPEMPLEVLRWDESNQISSANLRNGC
ncbi:hypothetical protein AAG570_002855 [Ranatra chinensis]|uniref:Protein THEM6 n=1 Tax=Ranatra chinensis TaxID=642074 RepID=A0ABD0Y791_9HEMI